MKKAVFLSLAVIGILCLAAIIHVVTDVNATDILKLYSSHGIVEDTENKSGFSIDKIMPSGDDIIVHVIFTNPKINKHEGNNEISLTRLQLFNAEDINAALSYRRAINTITVTKLGQSPVGHYAGSLLISPPIPRYVVVYFKGIPTSEFASAATPPSFFIVDLAPPDLNPFNSDEPRVLTEKPLLANGLFK